MAKKKYYAVKSGKIPGIYDTWEACKEQVTGVPGALYRGFFSLEEAEQYLCGQKTGVSEREESMHSDEIAAAYVDGSYSPEQNRFSCGVVLFWRGEEIDLSKSFDDPELSAMRNVAGEMKGAELAISYCLEHEIPEVIIYHDYQGIASWCTGEWQARKEGTRAYRDFYLRASQNIRIGFCKVKGHSGVLENEKADLLAKQALGLV